MASGRYTPPVRHLAAAFEDRVRKLGLSEQMWVNSAELRRWCERNKNHCYIPEQLLELWGIAVEAILSE